MKQFKWLAVFAVAWCGTPAMAADHLDSPSVTEDASTDINDLYAFIAPDDPNKIVLIMSVHPLAGADATFSDAAAYTFHVTNTATDPATDRDFTCTFAANTFTCSGPEGSGVMAAGNLGERADGDSISAWAGLADDPFFFDLGAFNRTVGLDDASNGFCLLDPDNGGNGDFFAGLNSLSIVLEIRKEVIGADGTWAIWASTSRIGG